MGLDSRAPGRAAAWALRKNVAGVPHPPKAANPSKLAPVLWAASSLSVRRHQLAGTGSCARDLDGGCAVSGYIAIGRGSYLSLSAGFRSDAGTINPDPKKTREGERAKNTTQARSSFWACCNDVCVYMPSHGIEVWSPLSGWKQTAGLGDQSVADAPTERLFFIDTCCFWENGVHPWEE